ncbi:antifungal protein ginkbilobin-like protein [Syzygium oleosum]|uniref:antifungal protein ginkbilobin-like protein n=1 Tax=Syzygium oleosum TaxID=219896 RepID=UPI0024B8C395|nr:antifungal protein ginkbilobin-like protein [Syzygium oleosum]
MAVFWRILAIEIWFFCICANVYCLPDTTVSYIICNGIKIPHCSAYGLAVEGVIDDLAGQTANNGYNYYTRSTNSAQVCYGHAACAGHLSSFDCHRCLVNAGYDLANGCPDNTGAQEQLKDCRMTYENYEFKE